MSISEITSTIQTSTVESSSSSTSEAEASYEVFIQLLAAQLEYQDPTDPTDANEFTNQLVQYSQLEQQMLSNETLTALLETQESGGASSGLDYLGRYVSVDTATATAGDEGVTWTVETPTATSFPRRRSSSTAAARITACRRTSRPPERTTPCR